MSTGDGIRRRDDILQVLYWMRGEGLGEAVAPDGLVRFLGEAVDRDTVAQDLAVLATSGLVEEKGDGSYALTSQGALEGGRRFADEFEGLTGQAHGECNDPECDCHTNPDAALECHARTHGHAESTTP